MPQQDYIKRAKPKPKKRTTTKRTSTAKASPAPHRKRWVALGLAVILSAFISFLWFIKSSSQSAQPTEPTVNEASTPKPSNTKKSDVPPPPTTEKWQYIEELKNKTVDVDVVELENKGPYIMQCGSFRLNEQAEALRAKMAFIGVEADIKRSTGKSGVWYRVVVDGFETKRAAESTRHRLKKNRVNGCRIWASK